MFTKTEALPGPWLKKDVVLLADLRRSFEGPHVHMNQHTHAHWCEL
jgi:hypothetical protein